MTTIQKTNTPSPECLRLQEDIGRKYPQFSKNKLPISVVQRIISDFGSSTGKRISDIDTLSDVPKNAVFQETSFPANEGRSITKTYRIASLKDGSVTLLPEGTINFLNTGGTYKSIKEGMIFSRQGGGHDLQSVVISNTPCTEKFQRDDFAHEVKICSGLEHKNILKLIASFFLLPNTGAMITPLCEQGTFYEAIDRDDPLKTRLKLAVDVLEGLDYLHGQRIIHRDIKEGNLLIKNEPTEKQRCIGVIGDLGSAMTREDWQAEYNEEKEQYPIYGMSAEYISPEFVFGQIIGPEVDLWAMGITLSRFLFKDPKKQSILRSGFFVPNHLIINQITKDCYFERRTIIPISKGTLPWEKEIRRVLGKLLDYDPETRMSAQEAAGQLRPLGKNIHPMESVPPLF